MEKHTNGFQLVLHERAKHKCVAPCLIKRQDSYVTVPFPGSVDSTTVQNIVIIAIASIIQYKSSYIDLQPYEYTA
jgi:hypothetical protein